MNKKTSEQLCNALLYIDSCLWRISEQTHGMALPKDVADEVGKEIEKAVKMIRKDETIV